MNAWRKNRVPAVGTCIETAPEPRELEGNWKAAGKLVLNRVNSGGRWITAYFSLDKTPPEMPTHIALRR